ncbi:hypothetical protein [Hoeflea sp.]|uniref:hypothetical protein n=1 Tax=Hoeflea sp. TaxID=1940281 RepID=UPI001993583A|nr:hypothetical protein [Hoeflea sp.]MBC7282888.1 SapC family protein [Hoeflea sp.]
MTGSKDKQADRLPLFCRAPEARSQERHGRKAPALGDDPGNAANAIVIPPMAAAMRSHPIAFAGSDHMPMVITRISDAENLFIDPYGKGVDRHCVPAHVRPYPVIPAMSGGDFIRLRKAKALATVCRHLASEQSDLAVASGKPLQHLKVLRT